MPRVMNKNSDEDKTGCVYIGRPTKWGNPFKIGPHGNREEVIAKYRQWIKTQPQLIDKARKELKGKNLLCYCYPFPCHGDVLLEVANGKMQKIDYHKETMETKVHIGTSEQVTVAEACDLLCKLNLKEQELGTR